MSRRKYQTRLEERYMSPVERWMGGFLAVCILLALAVFVATAPL